MTTETILTDYELLELAAKAAGMWKQDFSLGEDWLPVHDSGMGFYLAWGAGWWNPITNDGDALRLAVRLGLDLRIPWSPNQVFIQVGERGSVPFVLERIDGSPLSATRRAIVRAAAEIGKEMK